MGYLKCKSCEGIYELQEGEAPADFESCNCGGELEYYDSHGRKTRAVPIYSQGRPRSTTDSPIVRIIIIIFAFLAITQGAGQAVMAYIEATAEVGPSSAFLVFVIFLGIMAGVPVLIWFILKK